MTMDPDELTRLTAKRIQARRGSPRYAATYSSRMNRMGRSEPKPERMSGPPGPGLSPRGRARHPVDLSVPKAADQMVVDDPRRLKVRIDDRRADELEASGLE